MKKPFSVSLPVTLALTVWILAASTAGAGDIPGGDSAAAPIPLPVSVDLSGTGWAELLRSIQSAGKYVALDLSACTMTGTAFDPYRNTATGEGKIVALVLPDGAAGIADGMPSAPTFKHFTRLKQLTGAGIQTVGDYAFYGRTALETVSFPAAVSIGVFAFAGCDALQTPGLPAAQSIGVFAFAGCTALQTLDLPAAQSIDAVAFAGCTGLETVSLPASLTTIGINPFAGCTALTDITVDSGNPNYQAEAGKLLSKDGKTLIGYPAARGNLTLEGITGVDASAFAGCAALETIQLPAAAGIGNDAFAYCTALQAVSLPAAESIGAGVFLGCTALRTVNLPGAASIGRNAFHGTGGRKLTITLPRTAPAPADTGRNSFTRMDKTVIVKTPADRTGYDTAWQDNFTKAFGLSSGDTTVTITLKFEDR